jgi:hypothetical protein
LVNVGFTRDSDRQPSKCDPSCFEKKKVFDPPNLKNDSDYFFSHEDMKDFRSRVAILSVTARFLHSSLFAFSFDRLSAAAFSCARSLAAGFAGGPIVKLWLCAMAASGHVAAAPPRSVMNSRRLICPPRPGKGIVPAQTSRLEGGYRCPLWS